MLSGTHLPSSDIDFRFIIKVGIERQIHYSVFLSWTRFYSRALFGIHILKEARCNARKQASVKMGVYISVVSVEACITVVLVLRTVNFSVNFAKAEVVSTHHRTQ